MTSTAPAGPFQTILFCTDFSRNADLAFAAAVDQAARLEQPAFHLLHVLAEPEAQFWNTYLYEIDDVDNKAARDMAEKIEGAYRARLPQAMTMHVALRGGAADSEILSYAAHIGADLIVMGRQGHSSLGKILFGNVTEKVVRKAECAVLVIPLSTANRRM